MFLIGPDAIQFDAQVASVKIRQFRGAGELKKFFNLYKSLRIDDWSNWWVLQLELLVSFCRRVDSPNGRINQITLMKCELELKSSGFSCAVLGVCISTFDEFLGFRIRLSTVVEKLWCKIGLRYHEVSTRRKLSRNLDIFFLVFRVNEEFFKFSLFFKRNLKIKTITLLLQS